MTTTDQGGPLTPRESQRGASDESDTMPTLEMLALLDPRSRRKIEPAESGCWLWTGARDGLGYGFLTRASINRRAHRYIWQLLLGPIPDDLPLDHLCRVPSCVNPAHLEPVTPLENTRRGQGHGSETHCPQGHPYAGENLRRWRGRRYCRTCCIERARAWRLSRREGGR